MWGFEVFELLRKLFLSALAVFVFSGSPTQLYISSFVAYVASSVVLLLRPYRKPEDDLLAAAAHTEIFLLLSMGNLLRIGAGEKDVYNLAAYGAVMIITAIALVFMCLYSILHPLFSKPPRADGKEGDGAAPKHEDDGADCEAGQEPPVSKLAAMGSEPAGPFAPAGSLWPPPGHVTTETVQHFMEPPAAAALGPADAEGEGEPGPTASATASARAGEGTSEDLRLKPAASARPAARRVAGRARWP